MATTAFKVSEKGCIYNESMQALLKSIRRYKVLSAEEEEDLVLCAQGGDELAKQKLINHNIRFVISVAKNYRGNGLSMEDLVDAGIFGLINAADKFDPTRGFKFISFAVFYIRYAIYEELQKYGSTIRRPINKFKESHELEALEAMFEQENYRLPTKAELLDMLDKNVWNESKLSEVLECRHTIFSMDAPVNEFDDLRYEDTFSSYLPSTDSSLIKESLKADISHCLKHLTNRERYIIESFYGLNGCCAISEKEIAANLSLTPTRIRQIRCSVLKQMSKNPSINYLRSYFNCA